MQFVDANDPDNDPFGFIDPDEVIRAAFIMPAFEHDVTPALLGPSRLARTQPVKAGDDRNDYLYYEISLCALRPNFIGTHANVYI